MDPELIADLALTGLCTLAVGYRFVSWRRRPGDRSARAVFLMLLSLEIALLLGFPDIDQPIHHAIGDIPGMPQLVQHGSGMMAAYQVDVLIITVITADAAALDRRLRNRRSWLAIAYAVLLACYVVGPLRSGLPYLDMHGTRDWGVTAYVVAWQSYAAIALADTIRLRRLGISPQRRHLRLGLTLLTIGFAFVLAEIVHKIAYQVLAAAGMPLPWPESGPGGFQILVLLPAIVCVTAGVTIPSLGPRLAAWRRVRELAPLVDDLRGLVPRSPIAPRSARLHRSVITIRDAIIGPLAPHLDARDFDTARTRARESGLSEEDSQVVGEAACLAVAIDRTRAGAPPVEGLERPTLSHFDNVDAESAWLVRVAEAYRRSPLARQVIPHSIGPS